MSYKERKKQQKNEKAEFLNVSFQPSCVVGAVITQSPLLSSSVFCLSGHLGALLRCSSWLTILRILRFSFRGLIYLCSLAILCEGILTQSSRPGFLPGTLRSSLTVSRFLTANPRRHQGSESPFSSSLSSFSSTQTAQTCHFPDQKNLHGPNSWSGIRLSIYFFPILSFIFNQAGWHASTL